MIVSSSGTALTCRPVDGVTLSEISSCLSEPNPGGTYVGDKVSVTGEPCAAAVGVRVVNCWPVEQANVSATSGREGSLRIPMCMDELRLSLGFLPIRLRKQRDQCFRQLVASASRR